MPAPRCQPVFATLFAASLLTAGLCPADEPDPVRVRKLVEQLNSRDFKTREQATQELSKLEQVPDELRKAARSNDAEVQRRAQSAIDAITARAEDKAFKAIAADLQKVELDRFVKKMVEEANFAGDKQWDVVRQLSKTVTEKANDLASKKYDVPDPDIKSLPRAGGAANEDFQGKQVLVNDPTRSMTFVKDCVILSAGSTPRMTSLNNSIVIVNGDFSGATTVQNCLLIVHGNVGRMTNVRNSIILATGELERATSSEDCFFQVSNQQLRFTTSRNNVYVKSTPERADSDTNGRVLDTDRGPLQMLKFSDAKKNDPPTSEKP